MPNTVVTKLVTCHPSQCNFETGLLFDTLLLASSPAPPLLRSSSHAPPLQHLISSSPAPPLWHLLSPSPAPPPDCDPGPSVSPLGYHGGLVPFPGGASGPWNVQVFPATDTGQYWIFLASGIWPVLVFLLVFLFFVC